MQNCELHLFWAKPRMQSRECKMKTLASRCWCSNTRHFRDLLIPAHVQPSERAREKNKTLNSQHMHCLRCHCWEWPARNQGASWVGALKNLQWGGAGITTVSSLWGVKGWVCWWCISDHKQAEVTKSLTRGAATDRLTNNEGIWKIWTLNYSVSHNREALILLPLLSQRCLMIFWAEWHFWGASKLGKVSLVFFFFNDSSFCSCRRSSTAASSSSSGLLSRHPKMSSPGSWGREEVSSWADSPSPTATWHRPWARPPTTRRRAPTRPCAHSTSSSTRGGVTGQRWWDGGRCGRLHPHGSSTASQPSPSFRCRTLKLWTKTNFYHLQNHWEQVNRNVNKSRMWLNYHHGPPLKLKKILFLISDEELLSLSLSSRIWVRATPLFHMVLGRVHLFPQVQPGSYAAFTMASYVNISLLAHRRLKRGQSVWI